jgi:hypothetical protein
LDGRSLTSLGRRDEARSPGAWSKCITSSPASIASTSRGASSRGPRVNLPNRLLVLPALHRRGQRGDDGPRSGKYRG